MEKSILLLGLEAKARLFEAFCWSTNLTSEQYTNHMQRRLLKLFVLFRSGDFIEIRPEYKRTKKIQTEIASKSIKTKEESLAYLLFNEAMGYCDLLYYHYKRKLH